LRFIDRQEKRAPVIARNEAPKGQVTKQSAKGELPKESLSLRIASLRSVRNDREKVGARHVYPPSCLAGRALLNKFHTKRDECRNLSAFFSIYRLIDSSTFSLFLLILAHLLARCLRPAPHYAGLAGNVPIQQK
jgi:hypothetical protein